MKTTGDLAAARAALDSAIRRLPRERRTRQQAAAERLVSAISALLESGDVDPADRVTFEDARAAAEKYRKE